MDGANPDRTDLESRVSIARRRAAACSPASPSWDAAMGLVVELEDDLRELDRRTDSERHLAVVGSSAD
jgi:hypothetical protein